MRENGKIPQHSGKPLDSRRINRKSSCVCVLGCMEEGFGHYKKQDVCLLDKVLNPSVVYITLSCLSSVFPNSNCKVLYNNGWL